MARVILGLPHLSQGPLLDTARRLGAPVLVSAGALGRWRDDGPLPAGHEFNLLERTIRRLSGDRRPPSEAQKRRRARTWLGWNLGSLDRLQGDVELHLDSAGFVAMAIHGGWHWTPESYVLDLCSHPSIHRFSSMDCCVEPEVAPDRTEVERRIASTIHLNRRCSRLAQDAGIHDRFMPVIQGATAEDYLRCYDAISGTVREGATIGVGSMCRRATHGPDGSLEVIDRLDRELPRDVRLHAFGLKGDSTEMICAYGERIDSTDSQAYGIRARKEAQLRRAGGDRFSKTNAFVAGIMEEWYLDQTARMEKPRRPTLQPAMPFGRQEGRPATVLDALETIARAQFNDLVEGEQLEHDDMPCGRMLEEMTLEHASELPMGVALMDRWEGRRQLPAALLELTCERWFPTALAA